jgi:hypothetical protein
MPAITDAVAVAEGASAPPPDPRIHGLVLRAGLPVADREVTVMGSARAGGIVVMVTRTDLLGQYDFPLRGPGTYRVRIADQLAQQDGESTVRFQPVRAAAPLRVAVVPDHPMAAELRVRRRSYIEIVGERRDRHADSPTLCVELLDPVSGIRRAPPPPPQ